MRRLFLLGLLGLTGCANLCDNLFRARNVCRDQTAASAPATVVAAPIMGCAQMTCATPMMTEVMSSPIACDCAGVVMDTCVGCAGEAVVVGSSTIPGGVGAVQTVSENKGHPLLRPFRSVFRHHQSPSP